MSEGKAIAIFKDIHNDVAEVDEKINAIQEVTCMETYNGITKADMMEVLRWLMEEYL